MGGAKSKTPKKAAQAPKALPSGNQPQQGAAGGGGGAGGEIPSTIDIELWKISPVVWQDATIGSRVEILKQNGDFEVFLGGKRLGCIPPDYEDLLASRPTYRGTVKHKRERPIEVTVTVAVQL